MNNALSKKIYLELDPPTEEDSRSYQKRVLDGLKELGIRAQFSLGVLRTLYPVCDRAGWRVTVSLAYGGMNVGDHELWSVVKVEEGDTTREHYGLAVDLGSTSVVMQLVDCNTGEVIAQESSYNRQIAFGEDILTRIFYSKDQPDCLEELRLAAIDTFLEIMEKLKKLSGINPEKCISMVVAGNTCMIHFLMGMDAFCVFSAPYAVCADAPGFFPGTELGLPIPGYVYCYPGKANYLGGDIISGMIAVQMHKKETISLFFDVGTNGELVIGNKDFLLCGAGAAGPALEGGVVKTGMRAAKGAVEHLELVDGEFCLHTIGGGKPLGICGSGIVDMLSQLFIHGWLDFRGKLQPDASSEASEKIVYLEDSGEYAVKYAPDLYFYQSDVNEFIRTKAAAYTMMEYLLSTTGMSLDDVSDFYMAGAFGAHMRKESAVNIGMYPDVELSRIHTIGNSSLEGARMLLLDRSILGELDEILELMSYVQFGAVDDFLLRMVAASALPHTDLERYPSVAEKLYSL